MTTGLMLGVDIGTSDSKVLATTADGTEIAAVSTPTRWRSHPSPSGDQTWTDTDPELLARTVLELLERAVDEAGERVGAVSVQAIAITGMAEAGVLLDADSRPAHPVIAWFDPRGGDEMLALDSDLLDEFGGRTGLPVSALATLAKLAWMRKKGTYLPGRQWLSVPEFVAHRLGAGRAAEFSLIARTGLLDQESGKLWPEALAAIGADESLVPPLVVAGTPLGRAAGGSVPAVLHGAVLTVAGHDHPVAAVGCGVTAADTVFDSFGTAEALVRSVDGNVDFQARRRLALGGVNSVHHVLAGRRLLLGGTKAGLLLRRTVDLLGVATAEHRDRLDAAACALADSSAGAGPDDVGLAGIRVWGAANDDGALRITVTTDNVSPAALWLTAVGHGVKEAARCLELMAAEIGPATSAVVAGGWMRMESVRRSKIDSLPNVRFSDRSQAGAFGAAMFAAHAFAVAEEMSASGDPAGDRISSPIGPSPEFAARFTATPPAGAELPVPSTPPHRPKAREIAK